MEEFEITFNKSAYKADNPFYSDNSSYETSALISKTRNGESEIYHIRLLDIGLYSIYGVFDINCENGIFQFSEKDLPAFNLLKKDIIDKLIIELK